MTDDGWETAFGYTSPSGREVRFEYQPKDDNYKVRRVSQDADGNWSTEWTTEAVDCWFALE